MLAHRLRQRVRRQDVGAAQAPSAQVDWDAVRDAVSLQAAVILEEIVRLLEMQVRDAVARQSHGFKAQSAQELGQARRDDMLSRQASP